MNSITEKDSVSVVLIVLGEGTNMKSFYNEIWRYGKVWGFFARQLLTTIHTNR